MIYKLPKILFDNYCEVQKKDSLSFFERFAESKGYINIEFKDANYKCLPYLESVLDSKIQAISLFSGCGGLDIGTQMAGVKVLSSLDFDKDAINTLRHNKFFSHTKHILGDIRNISASDYSQLLRDNNPEKLILIGGPPCQPFSKAGYWKTLKERLGPEDPRNMIGQYLNLIDDLRPDGFILENVESILHPHNIQAIIDLQEVLVQMNYNFIIHKANAVDYGVPQKRKRVFVIASKRPINGIPEADTMQTNNLLNWIGVYDSEKYSTDTDSAEGKYYEQLKHVPMGKNYISLSAKKGYPDPQFIAGKRYWTFLLKLHPFMPSWTILSQPGHWEGPFHWKNRRLRVQEIASIQTFPTDYKILGSPRIIHKQVSNAVPCIMAKRMIEFLKQCI